jgi:hypothetical protein
MLNLLKDMNLSKMETTKPRKNNVVIEVPLNMCVSEMNARYRKLLSIPTTKEVFIDDVSKWAAQIIQSHLTRADMLADNSYELEHCDIIKPLTLNHELVGRIKEHFKQTH